MGGWERERERERERGGGGAREKQGRKKERSMRTLTYTLHNSGMAVSTMKNSGKKCLNKHMILFLTNLNSSHQSFRGGKRKKGKVVKRLPYLWQHRNHSSSSSESPYLEQVEY